MIVKLLIIMCFFIQILFCQRKILDPVEPTDDKPYMVYLVMAPQSNTNFTGWLCGGVIVHPYYVLTAASCIHDVQFVYVISGYRKYIPSEDIESDNCTRLLKKKIIHVCSHTRFRWHHTWHSWSTAEVGFARVDTPFDYRDKNYLKYCSYLPKAIPMSFMHVRPGDDAIVLGWGHNRYFRPKNDMQDYNMQTLQYSPVHVVPNVECQQAYRVDNDSLLDFFAICAESADVIDSEGNRLLPIELKYGCLDQNNDTEPNQETPLLAQEHRCNESAQYFYDSRKMFTEESYPKEMMNSRRGGICQNDHGGPLVIWRGGRETVVGVATMFLVSQDMECQGPFLFMSLHCINTFVYCLLPDLVHIGKSIRLKKLAYCNKTELRGFDMIERTLSWDDFDNASSTP